MPLSVSYLHVQDGRGRAGLFDNPTRPPTPLYISLESGN
jgi:hypothetical protein